VVSARLTRLLSVPDVGSALEHGHNVTRARAARLESENMDPFWISVAYMAAFAGLIYGGALAAKWWLERRKGR
jgi:hypothetical protein